MHMEGFFFFLQIPAPESIKKITWDVGMKILPKNMSENIKI